MEAYANLSVVGFVLIVSVVLLLLLLNKHPVGANENPKAGFIVQILVIWIFAWAVWAALWGFKAFSPREQQFEAKDFAHPAQLLASLKGTNANFAYL